MSVSIQPEFDRLLGGGILPSVLTQIYGVPASGKTNIAIIATVNASKVGRVVYVDPEGGFSVERVRQIAGERTEEVLSKLLLVQPTTFDEQKVAVSKLNDIVSAGGVSLVVVDSVAMLYRLEEDKDIRELGRILAQLMRIARKHNLPLLMTNQVYTDIDSQKIIPIGGIINEYWSKIMVELELRGGRRVALLRKHMFLPEGMRFEFKITNEGIVPVNGTSPGGSGESKS